MAVPRRLIQIVTALEPGLRTRIARIRIEPATEGGWDARICYLPTDSSGAPSGAPTPPETRHWLDLPLEQAESALHEQVRDLAGLAGLGDIRVESLDAARSPAERGGHAACSLAHPGWLLEVHRDSAGDTDTP